MVFSCKRNTCKKRSHHHDASSEFVGSSDLTLFVNELSDLWCFSNPWDLFGNFIGIHDCWNVDGSLNSTTLHFVLDGVNHSVGYLSLVFDWFEISSVVFATVEFLDSLLETNELWFHFTIDVGFPAGNSTHHSTSTVSIAWSSRSSRWVRTGANLSLTIWQNSRENWWSCVLSSNRNWNINNNNENTFFIRVWANVKSDFVVPSIYKLLGIVNWFKLSIWCSCHTNEFINLWFESSEHFYIIVIGCGLGTKFTKHASLRIFSSNQVFWLWRNQFIRGSIGYVVFATIQNWRIRFNSLSGGNKKCGDSGL